MKKYVGTTAIVACFAIALTAPISAPADPVVGQLSAPVAKTKRVAPAAKRSNTPVTRRADGPPMTPQNFATEAPEQVCVYDDDYSTGANNNGTTFCSKKLGYQDLPPERQGRISAADVPEGYVLVLFAGPGQNGATCRVAGRNAGLDPACNDMARGILLENATATQSAQVEQDRQRRVNQAASQGEGFAPQIERDRLAAVAANNARAAEERNALSRLIQEGRREADARAAEEAANGPARSARKEALSRGNAVTFLSTDGPYPDTFSEKGVAHDMPYLGAQWNDEIEVIKILEPEIKIIGFEHVNYGGRRIELTCGEWELIGDPENEISSIKIEYMERGGNTYCPPGRQEVRSWGR